MRAVCPMDKMNFKFFSSPVAIESLSEKKKTANILQYHQKFPHEMMSEEQAQKFHPQKSFGRGTDESIAKCCLFSQVTESHLV